MSKDNTDTKELYISTDIESDGPIPGVYSMLSFGSAAFTADKKLVSTFSANLETLPEAKEDPETMEWWKKQGEAWDVCHKNLKSPQIAMDEYLSWLKSLPQKLVFVGYPAAFDFSYIYWYLIKFTGECPFSFVACDIKTYAFAMLKEPFHSITKSTMPKYWFDKSKKSHVALDDAIEQGMLFCNMLAENNKSK